jgi:hypothetical protein
MIGWRSEALMRGLAQIGAARPSRLPSVHDMISNDNSAKARPMSVDEYARLAASDPDATRKFLQSRQIEEKRSEIDKLMNFLSRGKYE